MITIRIQSAVWFAAGIATAVILAAVFVGIRASAAPGPQEATFTPITPCRVLDTRPGSDNVGTRSTPIGPSEEHTQQITGTNGNCFVPSAATAVSMNVTAIQPTTASFITVFPEDDVLPVASNLNFVANQSPTPNKVDVKLSAAGAIKLFNHAGTVHVAGDIVGYYTNAGIQDLQRQINRNHTFTARVNADGTKGSTGSYTTTRVNEGRYRVDFDVEAFAISAKQGSIFIQGVATATSQCVEVTTATSYGGGSVSNEIWTSFVVIVKLRKGAAPHDCVVDVSMTFADRTPFTIGSS
jgi:hypothetical protein